MSRLPFPPTDFIMRKILFASLLLAGCSSTPLSTHKIDIQQGNFVNQEMVAKLQPGMTRQQVRFVLGTPLVADPFHADRWDYVYRFQKGGELVEQRHITAIFEGEKLKKVEGDVVPSSGLAAEAAGSTARSRLAERDPVRGAGPRLAGDVGDTKAVTPKSRTEIKSTRTEAETKPKKAEEPEKKGLTDRFLGLFGFGGDEAESGTLPKPTVERSRGSPVTSQAVAAAETRPTVTRSGGADAKSAEPTSTEPKIAPPRNAAEIAGIQEDGALRNREGKTIAEQLGDKLGYSGSEEEVEATTPPSGEKTPEAKKGGGFELRNREGKTITQQIKEKFGFGDDEEEETGTVEAVTTSDKPAATPKTKTDNAKTDNAKTDNTKTDNAKTDNAKTDNAKTDKDGWFTFRNREGKTITEQVKDLMGPPDSAAAQPARSAEPAPSSKGSSRGTISADEPQPATGSGKSLGQKILDIFGFD